MTSRGSGGVLATLAAGLGLEPGDVEGATWTWSVHSDRVRVGNARRTWTERAGVILRLLGPDGQVGFGEASPLPGWSIETLDEVCDVATRPCPAERLPSSLRFGLETAILDLVSRRAGRSVAEVLASSWSTDVREELPTAGLVDLFETEGRPPEPAAAVAKVKIGRPGRLEEEIVALRALRERLGGIGLRLDANRGLDPRDLSRVLDDLAEVGVELLEEPVGPVDWPRSSPVSLAVDETLAREWRELPSSAIVREVSRLREGGALAVLILKPALLGGFGRCRDLAQIALEAGVGIVISHLFDGPLALAACSALALTLPGEAYPAGLAPHGGLEAWPAAATPWWSDGRIRMPPGAVGLGLSVDSGGVS